MELIVFGMVLPWVLLGISCWLGILLLRQSGRILLRLEALEYQMVAMANGAAPSSDASPELPLGLAAPDFELPDLYEGKHSLAEYRGNMVVVVFFSPQCGYCTQMVPNLARIPKRRGGGLPRLVILTNGDAEQNRKLFRESGVESAVLLQSGDVAARYQCQGTPMGYLIDEEGRIASPRLAGADALLPLLGPTAAAVNGAAPGGKANKGLSHSRINRDGLSVGTPAPSFTLPTVAGGEVTLEQYRGQRVLLVFSDPECGPCDQLAPHLQELHRQRTDLQVLMVSRRELEANRTKVASLGLTFPVAIQKQWQISSLYAKFGTPIGYWIDEQGLIAKDVGEGVDAILGLVPAALQEAGQSPAQSSSSE